MSTSHQQPQGRNRTSRRNSDIVCPSHPDVTLMRQKRRSLFGSRMEVVHSECPLCAQEWPAYFQDQYGPPPGYDGGNSWDQGPNEGGGAGVTGFQPTAPFDDPSSRANSSRSLLQQANSASDGWGSAPVPSPSTTAGTLYDIDLTKSIMEMVHSLLDRDNPSRGPDFVVEQLELLCAWSLGDEGVLSVIMDAGGIYIVTNMLQHCQQALGPRVGPSPVEHDISVRTPHAQPLPQSQPPPPQQQVQIPPPATQRQSTPAAAASVFNANTTIATEPLDDTTTIITNEAELEEDQNQFDSMGGGFENTAAGQAVANPVAGVAALGAHDDLSGLGGDPRSSSFTASSRNPIPTSNGNGGDPRSSSFTASSRNPIPTSNGYGGMNQSMLSYPGSFYFSPPKSRKTPPQQATTPNSAPPSTAPPSNPPPSNPPTAPIPAATQAPAQANNSLRQPQKNPPPATTKRPPGPPTGYASVSGRDSVSSMPLRPQPGVKSAPAPTMGDIDRAFGHFLVPGSSSTTGGGSTWNPSASQWTTVTASQYTPTASVPMVPATVCSDKLDAQSVVSQTVSRRVPSISGSSVSAYVSARTPGDTARRSQANNSNSETDRAVQEARWGIATLANLSRDESAADIIRSAGGVETLLNIMWRLEEDEMVQDCGCECLATLVSGGQDERIHLRGLIASFGGVATVIKAMSRHPATPTLQFQCFRFITKMALGDPIALQSVVTLKGIGLMLLGMRMHRLDQKLQEAACLAVETVMTEGDQVYAEVVANRGVEAVLTAMWQFESNGLIQQYGCSALGLMCATDDGNKWLLTEAGAVETILSAMRTHNENVYIQRAGCLALCNLTDNYDPAVQRAIDEDAISTIRQLAAHDPERAKQLRLRLYRHRSRVFKSPA